MDLKELQTEIWCNVITIIHLSLETNLFRGFNNTQNKLPQKAILSRKNQKISDAYKIKDKNFSWSSYGL